MTNRSPIAVSVPVTCTSAQNQPCDGAGGAPRVPRCVPRPRLAGHALTARQGCACRRVASDYWLTCPSLARCDGRGSALLQSGTSVPVVLVQFLLACVSVLDRIQGSELVQCAATDVRCGQAARVVLADRTRAARHGSYYVMLPSGPAKVSTTIASSHVKAPPRAPRALLARPPARPQRSALMPPRSTACAGRAWTWRRPWAPSSAWSARPPARSRPHGSTQ
jgi:hypothetical protein